MLWRCGVSWMQSPSILWDADMSRRKRFKLRLKKTSWLKTSSVHFLSVGWCVEVPSSLFYWGTQCDGSFFSQQSVLQVRLQVWCCQVLRHVARRRPRISHCSSSSVWLDWPAAGGLLSLLNFSSSSSLLTPFSTSLPFLLPPPLTLSFIPPLLPLSSPLSMFVFPCFFTFSGCCSITGSRDCLHSSLLTVCCIMLFGADSSLFLTEEEQRLTKGGTLYPSQCFPHLKNIL